MSPGKRQAARVKAAHQKSAAKTTGTQFTCPACQFLYTSPIPAERIVHRCPARDGAVRVLREVAS